VSLIGSSSLSQTLFNILRTGQERDRKDLVPSWVLVVDHVLVEREKEKQNKNNLINSKQLVRLVGRNGYRL
jgi:hypothetical protein